MIKRNKNLFIIISIYLAITLILGIVLMFVIDYSALAIVFIVSSLLLLLYINFRRGSKIKYDYKKKNGIERKEDRKYIDYISHYKEVSKILWIIFIILVIITIIISAIVFNI